MSVNYRIGFGGRATLTLASWASAGLALLTFGSDAWIHAGVWSFVSITVYGTRRYLDTYSEQ